MTTTKPGTPHPAHRRRHDRGDRGSAAVEFALAVPILVLILAIIGQLFTWGLGYLAVQSAADHAVQTTRLVGGTPATGEDAATDLLHQLAPHLVTDAAVTVTRTATTTTVTIRATARGLPIPIAVTVEAPTERHAP